MRKLIIFLILTTPFILSSCQKGEVYSCDSKVDQFVKANLEEIKGMTRTQFIEVQNIDYQRGIYTAMSPEQRSALWRAKLVEVLTFQWNEEEFEHIKKLDEIIVANFCWFNQKRDLKKQDTYDLLAYKWVEYARETLLWSDQLIYAIAFTPAVLLDKTGKTSENEYMLPLTKSGDEGCNCNASESAGFPQCNGYMYNCNYNERCPDSWGCGLVWTAPCNADCVPR